MLGLGILIVNGNVFLLLSVSFESEFGFVSICLFVNV